jgi:hypothetical protein
VVSRYNAHKLTRGLASRIRRTPWDLEAQTNLMFADQKNKESSMNLSFNYGLAENASIREMQIETIISNWPEVYCEKVGRIHNTWTSEIKAAFKNLCLVLKQKVTFEKYREYTGGHAIYFIQLRTDLKTSHEEDAQFVIEMVAPRGSQINPATAYTEITIYGSNDFLTRRFARDLEKKFEDNLRYPHEEITWLYNDGGHIEDVVVPLKRYREIMPEVYPFVSSDLDAWVHRFIESDSNVLILNGPMGTGKSSLIAHIIQCGKFSAMTAFDDKVMKNDTLYTNFISWSQNLLVLEDADLLLLGRQDKDNDTMSKLLNVSEGIIDTKGKKIIFTANLGNIKDVDSALRRPGRCFDVVEFRELTLAEANVAREKLGKTPFTDPHRQYSLAQVYQTK